MSYEVHHEQDGSQKTMPDGSLAVLEVLGEGRHRWVSVNLPAYQRWMATGAVPTDVPYEAADQSFSLDEALTMLWQAAFPGTLDEAYAHRKIDDYAKLSAMMMVSLDDHGSARRNAIESLFYWQMMVVEEYERRKAALLFSFDENSTLSLDDIDLDFSQRWDQDQNMGAGAMVENPALETGDIWAINALSGTV